jgi:hypothetical protein
MQADLGLLVDAGFKMVRPQDLLGGGQPGVAIWYAHACCSADSLSTTAFNRLVPAGSNVDRILQGITACGDMTAPFPQALLSADRPALGDAAVELEQYSAGITIAAGHHGDGDRGKVAPADQRLDPYPALQPGFQTRRTVSAALGCQGQAYMDRQSLRL